jgi:hypothetical protein
MKKNDIIFLLLPKFSKYIEGIKHIKKENYSEDVSSTEQKEIVDFINSLTPDSIVRLFSYDEPTIHGIHGILYYLNDYIKIENNDSNSKLPILFHLVLLIRYDKDLINYSFSFDYIRKIYSIMKNETTGEYKILIISIIIIDLIYNYKGFYDEQNEIEDLKQIENECKKIIINNSIISIELEININSESNTIFVRDSIDKIYIKIIIKIIKDLLEQKQFEHYEKILKNQLDLEKINLTKAMHEELNSFLNNTNYINNYIISNINDLYNEDKINFNYILLKYIIKNSIYEYDNKLLKNTKKCY